MPRMPCSIVLVLLLVAATTIGCDKAGDLRETIGRGASQLREKVDQGVERVQQETGFKGGVELSMSPPVKTRACYASLIRVDAQRPAVLQLTSYESPEAETFPATFFRATLPVNSPAELAGQTVPVQAFVQAEANGPVWHTRQDELLQLQVVEVDEQRIVGRIVGGKLVDSASGKPTDVTGKFSGVWQ